MEGGREGEWFFLLQVSDIGDKGQVASNKLVTEYQVSKIFLVCIIRNLENCGNEFWGGNMTLARATHVDKACSLEILNPGS